MNPRRCPSIDADHRVRVLRALGMVPWTRRLPDRADADMVGKASLAGPSVMAGSLAACAVVLGHDCSSRALDLLGRALNAGGPLLARAGRVRLGAERMSETPAATTYLVFGRAQAVALQHGLAPEVLQHARMVVVDELEDVLADAGAKRRLWIALRGLRAALAAASG